MKLIDQPDNLYAVYMGWNFLPLYKIMYRPETVFSLEINGHDVPAEFIQNVYDQDIFVDEWGLTFTGELRDEQNGERYRFYRQKSNSLTW